MSEIRNIYWYIPDPFIPNMERDKYKISLNIYIYLFYLFRFYIYKDSLYILSHIINIKFNNNKIKKNNNILEYKNYFYKIFLILYKLDLIKIKINILILKDPVLLYKIVILKKKENIYNYKYFFKEKTNSIVLFTEFKLRLPFLLLMAYRKYIFNFKVFKYNEYILNSCELKNYPLLKKILRFKIKRKNPYWKKINWNFTIYFDNYNKKVNLDHYIIYNINNCKFLKLYKLLNKNNINFIFDYLKLYFLNTFYFYTYKIWILQTHSGVNEIQSYKWSVFYLLHLYWWLYKYDTELPIWLYILVIINIIKIYLNNINYNLYILDFKRIDYNKAIIKKINLIIFITHFEKVYKRFFYYRSYKYNKFYKVRKLWNKLLKFYPLDFLYIPIDEQNKDYLLDKYSYNFDNIHWKLFYTGNTDKIIKLNIGKNKEINNIVNEQMKIIKKNILLYSNKKPNLIINFFFLHYIIRDLYIKIFNSVFTNKFTFLIKYYIREKVMKQLKISKKNNLEQFKENNNNLFYFYYEKFLCLNIYIIFIIKYIL